jgi:hypothetical protein
VKEVTMNMDNAYYQKPPQKLLGAPGGGGGETGLYLDPRVNYVLRPGEQLVQCSYDKSHFIL